MSDEKSVDVSFDPRILAAVGTAHYTMRDTRKIGLKKDTYEVDFGKGAFFATFAVNKESGVTDKTLAALSERIASLQKVIANYTEPMRYGGAVSAFGSGIPRLPATAPRVGG